MATLILPQYAIAKRTAGRKSPVAPAPPGEAPAEPLTIRGDPHLLLVGTLHSLALMLVGGGVAYAYVPAGRVLLFIALGAWVAVLFGLWRRFGGTRTIAQLSAVGLTMHAAGKSAAEHFNWGDLAGVEYAGGRIAGRVRLLAAGGRIIRSYDAVLFGSGREARAFAELGQSWKALHPVGCAGPGAGIDPRIIWRPRPDALGQLDPQTAVRCMQCGYNLFGLSAAHRCPECGAPVRASVRGLWPERGRLLVRPRRTNILLLPRRCVRCNAAATGRVRQGGSQVPGAWFFLLVLIGGGPGDRYRLSYGLCARHRRWQRLAGRVLFLAALVALAMIGWIVGRCWLGGLPMAEQAWTAGGALLVIKLLLPAWRPVRVHDRLCRGYVRVDRLSPAFLEGESARDAAD